MIEELRLRIVQHVVELQEHALNEIQSSLQMLILRFVMIELLLSQIELNAIQQLLQLDEISEKTLIQSLLMELDEDYAQQKLPGALLAVILLEHALLVILERLLVVMHCNVMIVLQLLAIVLLEIQTLEPV